MNKRKLTWLVVLILLIPAVKAQQPIVVGTSLNFSSSILGETRQIQIYVPETEPGSLDDTQTIFPVVYVLDGEQNYLNVIATTQALHRAALMPSVMVVGISGANREWDYSPTDIGVEYMKTGGGDLFATFMEQELIPYINEKHPSSGHNTIIGHSLGAMFGLHVLHKKSSLCDNYMAISPSLWWDDSSLADQWLKDYPSIEFAGNKKVFMTMANEFTLGKDGMTMYNQYLRFKKELGNNEDLAMKYLDLFSEDHLSCLSRAHHEGLKYLFSDWNISHVYDQKDLTKLTTRLKSLSETYSFTVAPDYAQLVNMGRGFHNNSEYQKAIEAYQLGLSHFPEGLQLNGFLAQSYQAAQDLPNAKLYYEKGLELAKAKKSPMIEWFESRIGEISEVEK